MLTLHEPCKAKLKRMENCSHLYNVCHLMTRMMEYMSH